MNMLIIGGLVAIGLLALIGAVFLSLGEKSPAAATNAGSTINEPEATRPRKQQTTPLPPEPQPLPAYQEEDAMVLNGQFHELASELRTLHQQSLELRQRLGVLTEIADHLEHVQNNHARVLEDEVSTH